MRQQAYFGNLRISRVKLDGLFQAQNDQAFVHQHADVAVVVEKGPTVLRTALEQIAAEEHRLIGSSQKTKDSGRHIE